MIRNELRQIIRKLFNHKISLGINVIGLSLGLVFAILAFLYGQNEFKYDKHFANTQDVYLMACNNNRGQSMHYDQPPVFMNKILKSVPEIKNGMRMMHSDANLKIDALRFKVDDFVYVDSNFFNFCGWVRIPTNSDTQCCFVRTPVPVFSDSLRT